MSMCLLLYVYLHTYTPTSHHPCTSQCFTIGLAGSLNTSLFLCTFLLLRFFSVVNCCFGFFSINKICFIHETLSVVCKSFSVRLRPQTQSSVAMGSNFGSVPGWKEMFTAEHATDCATGTRFS